MVANSPAGTAPVPSVPAHSYTYRPAARRPQMASSESGGWSTVTEYMLIGILAASAIDTLLHRRGPADLAAGAVLALDAILDSRQALEDTRFNMGLMTFFAPAVAAAGVVLAIQVGRQIAALQK